VKEMESQQLKKMESAQLKKTKIPKGVLRALHATCLSIISLIAVCLPAQAGTTSLSFNEKNGLPVLTLDGVNIMQARYDYFGQAWSWQNITSTFSVDSPLRYSFAGAISGLNLTFAGAATVQADASAVWFANYDVTAPSANVIGGGITFLFDMKNFSGIMGTPTLLPDKKGWSWGKAGGPYVRFEFSQPVKDLYFELGNTSQLRSMFFKDSIAAGKYSFGATITSQGVTAGQTTSEQFGLADPNQWPETPMTWDVSPVDLSFLNAGEIPAGKNGFVKAIDDKLVFADGKPARFWGTNVAAYAIFNTSDANIAKEAQRISKLGYNLVRLHHHDSPWVSPNIYGTDKVTDTKTIDAESRRKVNLWVKALADEGIYTWLDLHVQRPLLAGDNIYGFDEIRKGKPSASLKGYAYVNESIQNIMMAFTEDYVSKINPYTNKAFKDDPSIVTVLITNENDITRHFGNSLLPNKNVPLHSNIYMNAANAFATKWGLPVEQTWKSWLHGPSKLFLNDLEQQLNRKMIDHLHEIGVRVPIVTTSFWGDDPLSSLPALTSGDMIDVHSYAPTGQLKINPSYGANITDAIGAAQVRGKPLSVSEWNNEPWPADDRHTLPIWMAAKALHQGWDSLLHYAYSQEPMNGDWMRASIWHTYTDPSFLATSPAAAIMYRRGDVREAFSSYVYAPTPTQLFGEEISVASAAAIRTASTVGKIQIAMPTTPQLPWLIPSKLNATDHIITDKNKVMLPVGAVEATSDTGELTQNWENGIYTVNSPRTQAIVGFIGGGRHKTKFLETNILTPSASVIAQSLDDKYVDLSSNILISIGTRARAKDTKILPYHVEPIKGEIIVRGKPGLRAYLGMGEKAPLMQSNYVDGQYHINLDGTSIVTLVVLK